MPSICENTLNLIPRIYNKYVCIKLWKCGLQLIRVQSEPVLHDKFISMQFAHSTITSASDCTTNHDTYTLIQMTKGVIKWLLFLEIISDIFCNIFGMRGEESETC